VLPYNINLKGRARQLRKTMTNAEILLWSKVKGKQLKELQFYRQKTIGSYIVDFYCPGAKLVVELDGGQHFTDKGIRKDKQRDEYLKELGVKALRIPDSDVFKNTEAVLKLIWESL
jgi:very-short-patch-repair endonuclease